MKKIVVASDSFKGSVSSLEVADACEKGIRKVYPQCQVVKLPIADGGEGTIDALVTATAGTRITCLVHNPLMQPIEAVYGILGDRRTAVIEMATASGLTLISPEQRNPMQTTTYGTGQLIRDALNRGCREFLIGIGGSATNDAGTGMLQALGFQFLDEAGQPLGQGGEILSHIARIDKSTIPEELSQCRFIVACDVNNPFSGPQGAAYIFAPQKGADAATVSLLDKGLKHFARLVYETENRAIDTIPGAGAAGGLGGGCIAFLHAQLKPGIDTVLDALDFARQIEGADLIITGEGKMDAQTIMGKAPIGIVRAAQQQRIPVIALTGSVEDIDLLNTAGFDAVYCIQQGPASLEQAMEKSFTCLNIERTISQCLRLSFSSSSYYSPTSSVTK